MKTPNLKLSLAALVAAASLGHARAATLTVTSLADSGPGTLRQRIAAAASGDTINFNVNGTITLTSGQFVVDKNLNIVGPPPNAYGLNWVTVSGNDQSRVFLIRVGNVTIANLNIAHGKNLYSQQEYPPSVVDGNGGGILNLGNLTLTHCTVRDNVASFAGCGIASLGHLAVNHCRILRNTTDNLYSSVGAGIACGGLSQHGDLEAASLSLNESTIADNFDVEEGAGLFYIGPSSKLKIVNSSILRNRGYSPDSGFGSDYGGASIRASTDRSGISAIIDGCTFADNADGGLRLEGPLEIKNSTISGNHGDKAGLEVLKSLDRPGNVVLNNVTITDNGGPYGRTAGIVVLTDDPRGSLLLQIKNSIVAGNTGSGGDDISGPIYSLGNNLIQDTTGGTIFGDQVGNIYVVSPELLDLAHNGGPTLTHALLNDSPPVDNGRDSTSEPTDQRGVARPVGPHSDIGAYEGSVPAPLRPIRVDILYNPAPYIIVCDPAGPFPSWQGAILGSRTFDVRSINPTTLRLQTRSAAPRSVAYRDINGDGIIDLALSFDLNQSLQGQECEAVTQLDLSGLTRSNQPIFGAVQVQVVAR